MDAEMLIGQAVEKKQKALSEHDSKLLLGLYDVPVTRERLAGSTEEAVSAAGELGFPVVLKACGHEITHKTERQLVAVGLKTDEEVRAAYECIVTRVGTDPFEGVLVQEMVEGKRELVIGLIRDPQFGPCVMFGLGGIFTEVLKDTSFRVAPITRDDALQMMDDIRAKDILGPVRGMAPADRETLARALLGLGRIGLEHPAVSEIDVNPLIIGDGGESVAVDALVVLQGDAG